MTLPANYRIDANPKLLHLYREGNEIYACPNKGSAEEALRDVAHWHDRERTALLEMWNSPHGSEEQAAWEKLRKEAEGKMLEAQKRASGVGQWR